MLRALARKLPHVERGSRPSFHDPCRPTTPLLTMVVGTVRRSDAAAPLRTLVLMSVALMVGFALGRRAPATAVVESSQSSDRLYLYVSFDVKPERRDEFLRQIRANEAATLGSEPLNRAYLWGEDIEVPNRFHFHEEYVGEAGQKAHFATDHFKVWDAFVKTDPFSGPVNGPYKFLAASPAPETYAGKYQN